LPTRSSAPWSCRARSAARCLRSCRRFRHRSRQLDRDFSPTDIGPPITRSRRSDATRPLAHEQLPSPGSSGDRTAMPGVLARSVTEQCGQVERPAWLGPRRSSPEHDIDRPYMEKIERPELHRYSRRGPAPSACTFTAGAVLGSLPVKLTATQVAEMRRLSTRGARQKVLAARFGVSPAHVSMILTGKRWADSSRAATLVIPSSGHGLARPNGTVPDPAPNVGIRAGSTAPLRRGVDHGSHVATSPTVGIAHSDSAWRTATGC
jgi:hypothetical protein